MTIFHWLTDWFFARGRALLLYKRGAAKARNHDHRGAITDYTACLAVSGAPAKLRSSVLYDRARGYLEMGEDEPGIRDLNAILTLHGAPDDVTMRAKQQLFIITSRRSKRDA